MKKQGPARVWVRHVHVELGFDEVHLPCKHTPPGAHGIQDDCWHFQVSNGPVAVVLVISSGVYPETVVNIPAELRKPRIIDMLLYESASTGEACSLVTGGQAVRHGARVEGKQLWAALGKPVLERQTEAFWKQLELVACRIADQRDAVRGSK